MSETRLTTLGATGGAMATAKKVEPWPSELVRFAFRLVSICEKNAAAFQTILNEFERKNYTIVPALMPGIVERTDSLIETVAEMMEIVEDESIKPRGRPPQWYRVIDADIIDYLRTLGGEPPRRVVEYKMYQLYADIDANSRRNMIASLSTLVALSAGHWQNLYDFVLEVPFGKSDNVIDERVTVRKRRKKKDENDSDIDPPINRWQFVCVD